MLSMKKRILFSMVDTVLVPFDIMSICQNMNEIRRLKVVFLNRAKTILTIEK